MKNYLIYINNKIETFISRLENEDYRFKVLMITTFIFLFCFLSLSNSNPFHFLFPNKIYPIMLYKPKKNFYYYSYDRETKQLKELTVSMFDSSDLEKNIINLAKIVQEPLPFLRGIHSRIETIYFPAYSLGIIHITKENSKLYIFYNNQIVEEYPYQREISKNNDFDFFSYYQKAFIKTIFKNYPEFSEIYWIDNNHIDIFKNN
ncbi:MAG: hypothetical protein KatS3mg129_1734 [Leptospiraceae bacterium]|nr:MAG: hypothetical protein KatS3mg129_1734 [Leptospiraceae bacterium]